MTGSANNHARPLADTMRGQPLVVLGAILGGWVLIRMMTWAPQMPAEIDLPNAVAPLVSQTGLQAESPQISALPAKQPELPEPILQQPELLRPLPVIEPMQPMPGWERAPTGAVHTSLSAAAPVSGHLTAPQASGHALLLAAGMSAIPLPRQLVQLHSNPAHSQAAALVTNPLTTTRWPLAPSTGHDRWSADAWVLLRDDTTTPVTSGRGSYGRSQAGAVVRYHLAPGSGHRLGFYARVTQALQGISQTEFAAGAFGRPIPRIPVALAAEVRASHIGDTVEIRPAAFAATELPPASLPLGTRGEAYVQAGYVGGDFATAFVDGQARIDRSLFKVEESDFRIGGGAWGGAQKGASRLDVGPSASVSLKIGQVPSRVSLDYRVRVAGEAEPSTGPALTITAGF